MRRGGCWELGKQEAQWREASLLVTAEGAGPLVSENGGGLCLVSTQLARPSMGFLQGSTMETREES